MQIITADFETFYCKKTKYSLSAMPTDAYVLDPRFQVIGVSVKVNDGVVQWMSGTHEQIANWFAGFDWANSAVLAHNTLFDGFIMTQIFGIKPKMWMDTLSMARAAFPWLASHSLANIANHLRLGTKGTEVHDADGLRREDFTPEQMAAYGRYCGNDTQLCYDIAQVLIPQTPLLEQYLIDMTIRMFTEPQFVGDIAAMQGMYEAEVRRKEELLALADVDRETIMSNDKFAAKLRSLGVVPPTKISAKTGKTAYAFAKTDKEFTALQEHPDTEVQGLVAARLGVKTTIAETRALRFVQMAKRGALPVYLNYWGAKCVPGSTEVLTPSGWVPLEQWDDAVPIAQVTPDRSVVFEKATKFVGSEAARWVDIAAPYLQCSFTEGHTMPYLAHGSFAWKTMQAGDIINKKSWYAPLAGRLDTDGTVTAEQLRVLVMVQADGTYAVTKGRAARLRISVKTPRKIARARQLLSAAGLDFSEQVYPSAPGYVSFVVNSSKLPGWLSPERKVFGSWVLQAERGGLEAFVEELRHWDGWACNGSEYYCSTVRANADWVCTVLHLVGKSGRISEKPASRGRQALYKVGIRARGHGLVRQEHISVVDRVEVPYCATTNTGFFLARSKGRIFVTGNTTGRFSGGNGTNWQNLSARGPSAGLRNAIKAPPGRKVVVGDSSNIELRVAMMLAGQMDVVDMIREGVDLYCEFASKIYGRKITKADKIERMLGKIAMLSLQYGAGAERFVEMARLQMAQAGIVSTVDLEEAQNIVGLYRTTYANIPLLWRHCERVVLPAIHNGDPLIGVDKQGWVLTTTNGMAIPGCPGIVYHNLRKNVEDGWEYTMGKTSVNIYGGKVVENACIAEGTLVLTDNGWKPIETVLPSDAVHDGDTFVNHGGLVFKSVQDCVTVDGVYMTPDHEVLTDEGWKAASQNPKPFRPDIREFDRHSSSAQRRQEEKLAVHLQLWKYLCESWCGRAQRNETRRHSELRVPIESANICEEQTPWYVAPSSVLGVAEHAGQVQATIAQSVQKLWRSWCKSMQRVGQLIRSVLERHGQRVCSRAYTRQNRQQRWVPCEELPLGELQGAGVEQAEQRRSGFSCNLKRDGGSKVNPILQVPSRASARKVYDIMDCGPQHRFVVMGDSGPFIVHNCQYVARMIVMWQTGRINRRYRVALSVHDEAVVLPMEHEVEECMQYLEECLSMAPSWVSGIPLASEVAVGDSYGEAK